VPYSPFLLIIQALGISFAEMHYINMCFVDSSNIPHARVHLHGYCPVDASHCNSITCLHSVYQVIMSEQNYSVRGLTCRHIICNKKYMSTNMFLAMDNVLRVYVKHFDSGVIVSSGLVECDATRLGKVKPPPLEDEGNTFL
jgi:hypothetical protein